MDVGFEIRIFRFFVEVYVGYLFIYLVSIGGVFFGYEF